tara:strand:+ start:545 stop:652 length:108 start_codon:yes stop_codon:yes gene_type:complete
MMNFMGYEKLDFRGEFMVFTLNFESGPLLLFIIKF